MKSLVTLLTAVLAVSEGVRWNDFRAGNMKLPINLREAQSKGWVLTEQDDTHGVDWYSLGNDMTFTVSFDQQTGYCAGVRVIIYEHDIDSDYLKLYKQSEGIFDRIQLNGETAYKSTVFFSPNDVQGYVKKNNQQDLKGEDEVAYFAFLKETSGKYKMLNRKVCEQSAASYTEQGCHSNFGLVLSQFGSDTSCKYLKPFYAIYDTDGTGDLIGFGWISFSAVAKSNSMAKPITADEAKLLFPRGPSCLTSYKNLAVVEIWLSFNEGQQTSCTSTSWVQGHCKNVKKDSQETEHSEESFWSKLFG